ncbi:MAG: bifunctional UDP-N-acetylglucosamine diphosphorylase/glucosamine-1-phosphate N-acetyltransferase GlmU [Pseudomonadota bacterium]|nr:bifunctional UDP-N-acetylglucosamine diphosphorylase/glucosamine-1-phosphate N-acetyltransferase GlmU [Pseudomonadota bacterium]MDE3036906.1 bifunctional UDP-N-acetylglucosamine diphosphorylase/glucosamine-1-phosphate N-acetyltransferase GlmU [Pseudomonadota bacterium]
MAPEYKHKFASVVLAAGKGERMKSALPKVMHRVAGQPLVAHALSALIPLKPEKTVAVVAPGMDSVKETAENALPGCQFAVQEKPLGTGDAVRAAGKALAGYPQTILVLYGDTPLLTPQTLSRILDAAASADLVVTGIRLVDPTGYGRLIVDGTGQLEEIIECRDATPEQKKLTLCNAGVMAVSGKYLFGLLAKLSAHNAAGEFYLTDIAALADEQGLHSHVVEVDAEEMLGVNSRAQLAEAERVMQQRLRVHAMQQGATLIDPDSVTLSMDTAFGRDVVIYPQVVFGPGVSVADNVEIRSFSHIEGARIEKGAVIGPFARLRPGSVIGEDAHVGNFVELKKTTLGRGAKANHLSYVGDTDVGANANIGAGAITCNYDGAQKHDTRIGAGAFIGSNTALVAPVVVGAGATVGAGSVITEDVPDGALAIARSAQVNKPGRAKREKK